MSRKGWQSTVIVGGQSYVGDKRARREGSMFSASRAALRGLGQPSEPNKLSNDEAQADLETYCQAREWRPPRYSIKRCTYTPPPQGEGTPRKARRNPRRKAARQRRLYCAEVNVGAERFLGEATYGIEPARAAAAREALDRKGQSSSLRSSNDPIKALLRFCRTQGLSEPDYFLYFGSSKALLSESLADSQNTSRADSISILDDVLKTFQSQERQLGLVVIYDDGQLTESIWNVRCSVGIGGHALEHFTGRGSSKQVAKKLAAQEAYEWLSMHLRGDVSVYTILCFADVSSKENAAEIDISCQNALRQVCHNLLEPMHDKVFAAILMTRPDCKAEIVSIGSGTSFNYHQIKNEEAVLDCHAEVLARRGLAEFLFHQIKTAQYDKSILSKIAGKYQVKEGVRFHLFVNKVPCGDAFIPWKAKGARAGCLHYRKDDGEGNVLDVPPGKENQYKVCCSAKIALWNVVGLQGALLAQLLTHPVYLSTILVKGACAGEIEGTICEASLKRAFFGRLQGLQNLPDGYEVNQPTIVVLPSDGGASGGSGSQKHTAFCWAAGSKKEEMIGTASGSHKKGYLDVSRRGFAKIWASFFPRDERKYREVKLAANEYQEAKRKCKAHFNQRGSKWIQRAIDPVPVPSFHDEM